MAGTPTSPLAPPLPGHALTAASTTAPWGGTGAQDHHQPRCPSIGVLASTSKSVIVLISQRSADHIRASGQTAALKGRIHDRTRKRNLTISEAGVTSIVHR